MYKIKNLLDSFCIMFNVHSNAVKSEVKSTVTGAKLFGLESYLQYLTSVMTLSVFINLIMSQFPPLKNVDNNATYFTRLLSF